MIYFFKWYYFHSYTYRVLYVILFVRQKLTSLFETLNIQVSTPHILTYIFNALDINKISDHKSLQRNSWEQFLGFLGNWIQVTSHTTCTVKRLPAWYASSRSHLKKKAAQSSIIPGKIYKIYTSNKREKINQKREE